MFTRRQFEWHLRQSIQRLGSGINCMEVVKIVRNDRFLLVCKTDCVSHFLDVAMVHYTTTDWFSLLKCRESEALSITTRPCILSKRRHIDRPPVIALGYIHIVDACPVWNHCMLCSRVDEVEAGNEGHCRRSFAARSLRALSCGSDGLALSATFFSSVVIVQNSICSN